MSKTAVGKRQHMLKTRRFGGFRALSRPLPQRRRRPKATTESRNGRVIIEFRLDGNLYQAQAIAVRPGYLPIKAAAVVCGHFTKADQIVVSAQCFGERCLSLRGGKCLRCGAGFYVPTAVMMLATVETAELYPDHFFGVCEACAAQRCDAELAQDTCAHFQKRLRPGVEISIVPEDILRARKRSAQFLGALDKLSEALGKMKAFDGKRPW